MTNRSRETTVPANAPATPSAAMVRTLSLVAAISGFLVVVVYHVTEPLIAANQRAAIEAALFEVIPGAVERRDFILTEDQIAAANETNAGQGQRLYAGYDQQGNLVGVALQAAGQGYQDTIRILYSYDPDCQCIRGMAMLQMAETPGIGNRIATDPEFQKNFESLNAGLNAAGSGLKHDITTVKHGDKRHPWQIDAISGATISSQAIGRMLNRSAQRVVPVIHHHLTKLQNPQGAQP